MSTGVNANQSVGREAGGRAARVLLPALVLTLVAAGAAWAGRASNGVKVAPGAAAQAAPVAAPPAAVANSGHPAAVPPAQAPSDWVQTTLKPSGFTPSQVSHAAGRVSLLVKNQSGLGEVTLRLSRAGGEKVTEVKLTEKVRAWSGSFELAAGTYTLSEAAHPEWSCSIVIE